jgi:hypothetical protein
MTSSLTVFGHLIDQNIHLNVEYLTHDALKLRNRFMKLLVAYLRLKWASARSIFSLSSFTCRLFYVQLVSYRLVCVDVGRKSNCVSYLAARWNLFSPHTRGVLNPGSFVFLALMPFKAEDMLKTRKTHRACGAIFQPGAVRLKFGSTWLFNAFFTYLVNGGCERAVTNLSQWLRQWDRETQEFVENKSKMNKQLARVEL